LKHCPKAAEPGETPRAMIIEDHRTRRDEAVRRL